MKRVKPLSDNDDDSSSDDSSALDTDSDDIDKSSKSSNKRSTSSKKKIIAGESVKKKKGFDFDALSRHGYKGGLSVLNVPPPKVDEKHNWSWSTGRDKSQDCAKNEETFEEREKTRAALSKGEQLTNVQTQKEKNLSFSHKEKRKRDLGQASRGKSYVEEEKRLLRDSGIYSGFDS